MNSGKDGAEPAKSPVKRFYRAQHDYDPQQHSPNIDPDTELSFKCGDVITVYGDMDGDGFFQVMHILSLLPFRDFF